jgi:hypothetical protein
VIGYAGLRIPIDLFREYPTFTLGLPNGQTLNIIMLIVGIGALALNIYNSQTKNVPESPETDDNKVHGLWLRRLALVAVCIVPLVIPSDATRDVPATYGKRHPGLEHSWMYPDIADALDEAQRKRELRK